MTATDPFVRRRDSAQATLDGWRDKPYRMGRRDCVRMAASHLRRMGYKVRLPASGSYASERSALAALNAAGHADLAAAVDAIGLERIPPAAVVVGDLMMAKGDGPIDALHVVLGNGRTVGYHQDAIGACVLQPVDVVAAWRVVPR